MDCIVARKIRVKQLYNTICLTKCIYAYNIYIYTAIPDKCDVTITIQGVPDQFDEFVFKIVLRLSNSTGTLCIYPCASVQ